MKKALKWINAGAFTAMVTVNALANLLPIGGRTTGQVSEAYPNLFTPAPITFAVWGLIYLMLLLFTLYQLGILDRSGQSTAVREKIGPWFAISCGINILWIFLWHFQRIGLSAVCIAMLLITLIVITGRLKDMNGGLLQRIAVHAGFSLYYGWIIAATIANISVCLTWLGWDGWGISADIWTIVILLVGAGIACAVALTGRNWIAALSVMWAYAGILIRHLSPVWYGGSHPWVIAAGFVSEMLILATILLPKLIGKCGRQAPADCGSCQTMKE